MTENINDPKAWMESKRALGWTISEQVRSWEPSKYGYGEMHIKEVHMLDENGNFAGVLTRETYKDGVWFHKWNWMPFVLTAEDCL